MASTNRTSRRSLCLTSRSTSRWLTRVYCRRRGQIIWEFSDVIFNEIIERFNAKMNNKTISRFANYIFAARYLTILSRFYGICPLSASDCKFSVPVDIVCLQLRRPSGARPRRRESRRRGARRRQRRYRVSVRFIDFWRVSCGKLQKIGNFFEFLLRKQQI